MALVVEQDEAPNPTDVRLLGARAVVARPQALANLIEQTGWLGRDLAGLAEARPRQGNDRSNGGAIPATEGHEPPQLRKSCPPVARGLRPYSRVRTLSASSDLQQHALGILHAFFHADQELHGFAAVYQPVVVGEGEEHHGSDD